MSKLYVDMWYGDSIEDVDKISISFSDIDCVYRGNIYIKEKTVGDYSCADASVLERIFPQLTFKWD